MGRYRGRGRDRIEETSRLTIDDLRTWGCLHEGFCRKYIELRRGEEKTGSLCFEVHIKDPRNYIKFDYLLDKKPVAYEHEIELFLCYFGGHRFYFRCRHCKRRVTALYLSWGYYACRYCQRLAYEASQRHRSPLESLRRAGNIEDRAEQLRRYGHPRKANRLLWRAYPLYGEARAELRAYRPGRGRL
jgi:hypothetical protein